MGRIECDSLLTVQVFSNINLLDRIANFEFFVHAIPFFNFFYMCKYKYTTKFKYKLQTNPPDYLYLYVYAL